MRKILIIWTDVRSIWMHVPSICTYFQTKERIYWLLGAIYHLFVLKHRLSVFTSYLMLQIYGSSELMSKQNGTQCFVSYILYQQAYIHTKFLLPMSYTLLLAHLFYVFNSWSSNLYFSDTVFVWGKRCQLILILSTLRFLAKLNFLSFGRKSDIF